MGQGVNTYPDYRGIDLAPFVGWLVVCTSAYCQHRTVLGRIAESESLPGGHYIECEGKVAPAYGAVWQLPRPRKPRTEARELLIGGWRPGVGVDREASAATGIPLTERVACFNCPKVVSLHRLSHNDLRRPAEGE